MPAETSFSLASLSIAGATPFAAMVRGDLAIALAALRSDALGGTLLDVLDRWDDALPALVDAAARWAAGEASLVGLAAPLRLFVTHVPLRPRQIFCVGANYRRHVTEIVLGDPAMRAGAIAAAQNDDDRRKLVERMMDERARDAEPYVFVKLPSAVSGPIEPLTLPRDAEKIDWECELAVVIGRGGSDIAAHDASSHVAGYAIANDITARDLVFRRDVPLMGTDWLSAKSRPGFLPLGPVVVPAPFVDPTALKIRLAVNDRVMQDESTADMLIPIERQIEYLSARIQLLPGDVICTGSPAGNGSHHGVFLRPGDLMVASITGLGEQRTLCR